MIRRCEEGDFEAIWEIVNDGAAAYRDVIPADCRHEPYMTHEELRREIDDGVTFWGFAADGELAGVMGIQPVHDVTLIRHAYVRTAQQKQGIGARLLAHLQEFTHGPLLVGTWRDAAWAIRFYEKHGFRMLQDDVYQIVIRRYWKIPERQIETSVVLADRKWLELHPVE
ncbi:MAG TPA: GNAT family N-acetyltransferase [Terracidiphilus sp.]|nr:GNAT family N-acetyltransferase [Terracidiphilus sp.]